MINQRKSSIVNLFGAVVLSFMPPILDDIHDRHSSQECIEIAKTLGTAMALQAISTARTHDPNTPTGQSELEKRMLILDEIIAIIQYPALQNCSPSNVLAEAQSAVFRIHQILLLEQKKLAAPLEHAI